jgi:hypothetical protein
MSRLVLNCRDFIVASRKSRKMQHVYARPSHHFGLAKQPIAN